MAAPRGRPPKPTTRHKADGTYRKDRHNDRPARDLDPDSVEPPDDFDDEQAAEFRSIVARLAAVGIVVKLSDAYTVERAALNLVTARRARRLLAESGRYHEGQRGLTLHPAARDEKSAWEAFDSAATKLGLSPLDRERIKANETLEEDPLDKLARERAEQRAATTAAAAPEPPKPATRKKRPAAKKPTAPKKSPTKAKPAARKRKA